MITTTMSASERFELSSYRIPGSDSCFYIPEFITEGEEAYLIRKVAPGFRPALGPSIYERLQIRDSPVQRWKQLANRRLQLWGGELTSNNVLVAQPMPSFVETYPDIINRLQQTGVFHGSPHGKPNHIIMSLVPSTDPSQTRADDSPGTKFVPCLLCVVDIFLTVEVCVCVRVRSMSQAKTVPPRSSSTPSMSNRQLQPHEDGPAYHPAVATISLNSHCVFHYYRYTLPESHGGRSIDPTPVLSLLLEPRSVVISTDSLYSNRLHSYVPPFQARLGMPDQRARRIHEIKEDRFTAGGAADFVSPIANWERVTDAATREVLANGGALTRGTRYSLTCRDVGKVAQLKSFVKR
ncbi:unnamed protein product [Mycena citricolor]|uniref:Uncharacterized protein n=1 Tax=Mycena citricolor TaxID=2018698 RepID=A0AAD2K0C4_9AGAR|nr:unnamed protein product [Mycena citricolor]